MRWEEGKQRKKEGEGKKEKKGRKEGRGKDRGKREEKKGEERSGGWSDSREHISPSLFFQMVRLHTSHLQS